jgi:hypothetical protein
MYAYEETPLDIRTIVAEVKPTAKTTKEIIKEEAMKLETPQESVAFLNLMLKQNEKVQRHQRRLATFSKLLMFTGLAMAGFTAFCYMSTSTAKSTQHKLGASQGSSAEEQGLASMANGLSVLIWSMIAAKAKTGMSAASDGSSKSVTGYLKNAGTLVFMIALASGFNIYAQMDDLNSVSATTPTLQSAKPSLKSIKSVPTVQDSHYKGGVASAAFDHFATLTSDAFKTEATEKKTAVKETSKRGRSIKNAVGVPSLSGRKVLEEPKTAKFASIDLIVNSFEKKASAGVKKMKSATNSTQEIQSLGAFMLFIVTSGISIAYYVTFKTYLASLKTMDTLKAMLVNPNARVAAGAEGKSIMTKISNNKKKIENPKKIAKKATKANDTATLLKQLIKARKADKKETEGYEIPLLESSHAKSVVKASNED